MKTFFQTFTVTVASPAVFTCTDHNLSIGDEIILETTGALPTGLYSHTSTTYPDQSYFVIRDGLTVSTFQIAELNYTGFNGAPVVTTGTQSGAHTFQKINHDKITYNQTPWW